MFFLHTKDIQQKPRQGERSMIKPVTLFLTRKTMNKNIRIYTVHIKLINLILDKFWPEKNIQSLQKSAIDFQSNSAKTCQTRKMRCFCRISDKGHMHNVKILVFNEARSCLDYITSSMYDGYKILVEMSIWSDVSHAFLESIWNYVYIYIVFIFF